MGMTVAKSLYTTIEGPAGKADIFEVISESPSWTISYEVRFANERHTFETEGEATVVAHELVGKDEPFKAAGLTF